MTTRPHQQAEANARSHPPTVGRPAIVDPSARELGTGAPPGATRLSPRTMLALQRRAGNAAVARLVERAHPVVQRAVVAIDGPGEDATNLEGQATRACLENLTTAKTHKAGRVGLDPGGPRGQVAGPAPVGHVTSQIRPGFLSPQETLYVLGHGSGKTVAGLDPPTMAATLRAWFNQDFFGKLKLVSCVSASTDPRLGVSKTYADALAAEFARSIPAAAGSTVARKLGGFLPSSVDGIVGVGWVDEHSGHLLSIPLDDYFALTRKQREAFGLKDRAARSSAIRLALPGAPGTYAGKGGKRRYPVG